MPYQQNIELDTRKAERPFLGRQIRAEAHDTVKAGFCSQNEKVLALIRAANRPLSRHEIAVLLRMPDTSVCRSVNHLVSNGEVEIVSDANGKPLLEYSEFNGRRVGHATYQIGRKEK